MRLRERQDQLERAWWEEKAELSAGPAEQGGGGRFSDSQQEPESGHTSWQVADTSSGSWVLSLEHFSQFGNCTIRAVHKAAEAALTSSCTLPNSLKS